MYNLNTKKEKSRMTFRIQPMKCAVNRKAAYPLCKESRVLCKELDESYLLPDQLKALELAGYKIDYEETNGIKEPFYTRSNVP